jgi:hypothetical protein
MIRYGGEILTLILINSPYHRRFDARFPLRRTISGSAACTLCVSGAVIFFFNGDTDVFHGRLTTDSPR